MNHHPISTNPAFQAWFSGSVLTEVNGEPQVLYHGTRQAWKNNRFLRGKAAHNRHSMGFHFGGKSAANARIAPIIQEMIAMPYLADIWGNAPAIMPVYLRITRPLRLRDIGAWHDPKWVQRALVEAGITPAGKTIAQLEKEVQALGYDGIEYPNEFEGLKGELSYIVFHSTQVKSAIGNTGRFNPKSSDITDQAI